MSNKNVKRLLAAGLVAVMTVGLLAGCGGKGKGSKGGDTDFTWWISTNDADGQWYEKYEENPGVQFINNQYWDSENGGIGTEETGKKLNFEYIVPITGSEQDNFNTMMATGEYPEIVCAAYGGETAAAMAENGIAMDLTEYVEKYMPNYLAYLDKNPELKPFVTAKGKDGKAHYYAIYGIIDGMEDPFQGTCYRRDWIVKYAQPTDYVWDWESDEVKENGHPAVTPLEKAKAENNFAGWKKNEVTAFTADYGDDPNNTYTDNVIFPSGTEDPLTISDWEWMLEAFDKAITERGWADDSSSYGYTVYYPGYFGMGDVVSSFGGGTGSFYVKDGKVSYDGNSENFKTYVECMQNWYNKGWLDSEFNTRSADIFFSINATGVSQGKVGMWCGLSSTLGDVIRPTCADATDQAEAYVKGCSLPINDMYGTKEQMFKDPDSLFQMSRVGTPVIITNKAEGKDLATLFTYLDWTYTLEGAKVLRLGLNEEQLASMDFEPDLYGDNGIKKAYSEEVGEDGIPVLTQEYDQSSTLSSAVICHRMDTGIKLTGSGVEAKVEKTNDKVINDAMEQWTKFTNKGNIFDYAVLYTPKESETYNKINTAITDYQSANLPNVIKGTMSWEEYSAGCDKVDVATVCEIVQNYVDVANAK